MDGLTLPTQALEDDASNDAAQQNDVWGRLIPFHGDVVHVDLKEDQYTLGRAKTCDIRLSNPLWSQHHCTIYRSEPDGGSGERFVFVQDMSSNGTFVDGRKIGRAMRQVLSHGALLSFSGAKTDYMFQAVKPFVTPEAESAAPSILKNYNIRETLGNGNFAVVKKAVDLKTCRSCAVKIIDKKKILLQPALALAFQREVDILRKIKHPGVVTYIDYYDEEDYIYIVLELATGGELARKIFRPAHERLPENDVKFVFFQLALALKYLHDRQITHRDLKPENVLIASKDNLRVMITDFGLSRMSSQASMMNTVCGTPLYLAPEILNNTEGSGYDRAVDCWSMGVMLYVMLSGQPPFQDESRDALFNKIARGQFAFDPATWHGISPMVVDLIKRLLVLDPAKRFNVDQMLSHPWLQDVGLLHRYEALQRGLPDSYQMDDVVPSSLRSGLTNLIGGAGLQSAMMDVDVQVPMNGASSLMQVDVRPAEPPQPQPLADGVFKVPMPPKRAPPLPPTAVASAAAPPPPVKAMSVDHVTVDTTTAAVTSPLAVTMDQLTGNAATTAMAPVTPISLSPEALSKRKRSDSGEPGLPAKRSPGRSSPLPDTLTPPLPSVSSTASVGSVGSSSYSTIGAWLQLKSLNSKDYPHVNLTTDMASFGRDKTNCHAQLCFTAPRISSVHCVIRRRSDGGADLQDLSSNGTYVNEKLVGKGNVVPLSFMDEIVLLRDDKGKVLIGYVAKFVK